MKGTSQEITGTEKLPEEALVKGITKVARPKGRPKKNPPTEIVTITPKPKGRPRKNPPQPPKTTSRPKGRPRKNPLKTIEEKIIKEEKPRAAKLKALEKLTPEDVPVVSLSSRRKNK